MRKQKDKSDCETFFHKVKTRKDKTTDKRELGSEGNKDTELSILSWVLVGSWMELKNKKL